MKSFFDNWTFPILLAIYCLTAALTIVVNLPKV
ncbi:yvrj protein family [Caudoviricetes sp.]|nr:yvrj protein family [Caudoviricetes sp.]